MGFASSHGIHRRSGKACPVQALEEIEELKEALGQPELQTLPPSKLSIGSENGDCVIAFLLPGDIVHIDVRTRSALHLDALADWLEHYYAWRAYLETKE